MEAAKRLEDQRAEQVVLGAMLMDPSARTKAVEALSPADLSLPSHRGLFRWLVERHHRGERCDEMVVYAQIRSMGDRAFIRPGQVQSLLDSVVVASEVDFWLERVRDLGLRRRVAEHGRYLGEVAIRADTGEEAAILAEAGMPSPSGNKGGPAPIGESVLKALAMSEERSRARLEGRRYGLKTGFTELDDLLGPLEPGWMVIVGGRPSMGKTALAMEVALCAALDGAKVGFLSLEMPGHQIADRALSRLSGVPTTAIRNGSLSSQQAGLIEDAADRLYDCAWQLDERAGLNIGQVEASARMMHRRLSGLDWLFVDYLQLIYGTGAERNREQEVAVVSQRLKETAKRLGCVVVAAVQLNRSLEGRSKKRPLLSDLRSSGQIEQDADIVIYPYRHAVYRPDEADPNEAELIVRKHRHGPVGTARAQWDSGFGQFRCEGLQ